MFNSLRSLSVMAVMYASEPHPFNAKSGRILLPVICSLTVQTKACGHGSSKHSATANLTITLCGD